MCEHDYFIISASFGENVHFTHIHVHFIDVNRIKKNKTQSKTEMKRKKIC